MSLYYRLLDLFSQRQALTTLLIIALLASVFSFRFQFSTDDYMQWAVFSNPPVLVEKELVIPKETQTFWHQISNQFNFFDREMGKQASLKEWGAIPWWTDPEASLHLFRPISSITHWLDYQLWPENTLVMILHGVVYYLLLVVVVFALYKRIMPSVGIAGIATLFFIMDPSVKYALTWVASRNAVITALFGMLAILLHFRWREQGDAKWLMLSLVTLLCSLLSAEAGIGCFAYILAYALVLDKGSFPQRLYTVLPAAVVIVLWRVIYQKVGFGAQEIGHYIDPGRDPLFFIQQIFTGGPLLVFQQFIGIDNLDRMISPVAKQWLYGLALVGSAGLLWLFASLLMRNKEARFWTLGVIFAIVPPCALTHTDGRVMFFIALGSFALVSLYLLDIYSMSREKLVFKKPNWLRRSTAAMFVYVYIVIMAGGHLFITIYAYGVAEVPRGKQPLKALYDYETAGPVSNDDHLIVVTSPHPFGSMFYPYHAAYNGMEIPQSLRILTPVFSDVEVKRLSDTEFLVRPQGGFLISNDSRMPDDFAINAIHMAHNARNMMGFYRRGEFDFQQGQVFKFDELTISLLEVDQGRPMAIHVELTMQLDQAPYRLVSWNWKDNQYEVFNLPEIGQSINIDGPFRHYIDAKENTTRQKVAQVTAEEKVESI